MKPGDWLEIFDITLGIFGISLGVMAMVASHQQQVAGQSGVAVSIPRVSYTNGQVFVDVREGGWYRLEDFVQPNDPLVTRVVRQLV